MKTEPASSSQFPSKSGIDISDTNSPQKTESIFNSMINHIPPMKDTIQEPLVPVEGVTRETIFSLYDSFLKEYHKQLSGSSSCKVIDHYSKFDSPPKSAGVSFHVFDLYLIFKSLENVLLTPPWSKVCFCII